MMGLSFPAMRYSLGKERRIGRRRGQKKNETIFEMHFLKRKSLIERAFKKKRLKENENINKKKKIN